MRAFGCSKFKRLSSEMDFVEKHKAVCAECSAFESQSSMALNFLRAATIDVEVNPMFEDRVIRKLRVQTTRESIRYWSPAVAGAFIAGLAVVAALQIITRSAQLPHVKLPGSEAHRIAPLKSSPALNQNFEVNLPR
jgi:hypothetical protein